MGPRTSLPTHSLKLFVASQTVSFLQPSTYGSPDVLAAGYFLYFRGASLFLPLSLRDLRTSRPSLVLIRARKP